MGLGVRSLEIQDFILFTWPLPCAWGGYDYLYFAEEETEVQRGPVTCSMSKGQSWDINVGHLSSTPWGLVRWEWTLQLTKPHSSVILTVSDRLGSSSRKQTENKKEI